MNITKKKKGGIIAAAVIIILALAAGIFAAAAGNSGKKEVYLTACWDYNYESIEELAKDSDLIALVTVTGIDGVTVESDIPYTTFNVEVVTPVYNSNEGEAFKIYMTGGETEDAIVQIEDDPLLQAGDEALVFCRKNEDGTYRILSGAQGRLIYENGELSSLNVINSAVAKANPYSNIAVDRADSAALIEEIKSYTE